MSYRNLVEFADAENVAFMVQKDDMTKGHAYFTFDLLENCESKECSAEVLMSGYLSLDIELEEALADPHIMTTIAFAPASFDLTKEGECRITKAVQ